MRRSNRFTIFATGLACLTSLAAEPIPHNQDRAPGPALSPAEALAKMSLPNGFEATVFASEPDLVNPVAMTFDDRGRVWVTESLEYPRLSAGPGRDRIKILEDTDRDGRCDKVTIFAEGLNIPSGIALGHGGVFVANSPDLLFLRDADGDGRADTREVLLTGFGRSDTHELPNNLLFGPDGWLYGLNGVFNHSRITHQGRTHAFNCALFRYHPVTREFELFSEGTSNPWGLDYDRAGEFFVSACVVDHLWHLSETGYYHRQAGAYPPETWKIESIVKHSHQKAAYCGMCFYDADLFPKEYQGAALMGNIHANGINHDRIERRGASYFATGRPDFFLANDTWFMPVSQKVGPDGALWALDWYDRYHCYQDARRDPDGIERGRGRLYRIAPRGSAIPAAPRLDRESDHGLIERLGHPNVWHRRAARRNLIERGVKGPELEAVALSSVEPAAIEALWTLVSQGPLRTAFHERVLGAADYRFRVWGIRAAALAKGSPDHVVQRKVIELAGDADPAVRLAVLVAAKRRPEWAEPATVLGRVLDRVGEDSSGLTARLIWKNFSPGLFPAGAEDWALRTHRPDGDALELRRRMVKRQFEVDRAEGPDGWERTTNRLLSSEETDSRLQTNWLRSLAGAEAGSGKALDDRQLARLWAANQKTFQSWLERPAADSRAAAATLVGHRAGVPEARRRAVELAADRSAPQGARIELADLLARRDAAALLKLAAAALDPNSGEDGEFLAALIGSLGKTREPAVGELLVGAYPRVAPDLRPNIIDVLVSRGIWASTLLAAASGDRIPRRAVNANHLRAILALKDQPLTAEVERLFGKVRAERSPDRERVIAKYRQIARSKPGDAARGAKVFEKTCSVCHLMNGKGHEVGPDLTRNGRDSVEQILSNLLDPNLVIGRGYEAWIVATSDGRVAQGLLVENGERRVTLKLAAGKLEQFAREDIESLRPLPISLMPEALETQLTEGEFVDLIAYLAADLRAAR